MIVETLIKALNRLPKNADVEFYKNETSHYIEEIKTVYTLSIHECDEEGELLKTPKFEEFTPDIHIILG